MEITPSYQEHKVGGFLEVLSYPKKHSIRGSLDFSSDVSPLPLPLLEPFTFSQPTAACAACAAWPFGLSLKRARKLRTSRETPNGRSGMKGLSQGSAESMKDVWFVCLLPSFASVLFLSSFYSWKLEINDTFASFGYLKQGCQFPFGQAIGRSNSPLCYLSK